MNTKLMTLGVIAMFLLAGLGTFNVAAAPPGPTVVDVVIDINREGPYAGQFDTLITALTVADQSVIKALHGNGQFTVFAPTDAAFAKLGLDQNNIGNNVPKDYLTDVLLYHVAHGKLNTEAVLPKDRINTLIRGKNGFLMQENGVLTDNLGHESTIIVYDLEAANGVIHVVDTVLFPYQL
jgi:uncharacterized surface protein with fasciclin (FAS1) repeats